jgi:hypothetical protein
MSNGQQDNTQFSNRRVHSIKPTVTGDDVYLQIIDNKQRGGNGSILGRNVAGVGGYHH